MPITHKPSAGLNPRVAGLRCIRCGAGLPVGDYFEGCPACLKQKNPASLAVEYRAFPATLQSLADWQVYPEHVTLGEGETPLVSLEGLANETGIRTLHLKNEGANPTGSHKDRMSRFVVQRALDTDAPIVAAASSGNAGVSLAAYAAKAGLGCVVVTTSEMNPNWRRAIEMHGATLLAAPTPERRWEVLAERARCGEWFPATNFSLPAVGSNPIGVDGYRSLAFEIFRDPQGRQCTDIVVPTSRGDLLWGIARGYRDLKAAGFLEVPPRVHAVEPFPRLSRVLAGEDYRETFPGNSALTSIGGSTVTFQAVDAIELCKGSAAAVEDAAAQADQIRLARSGFYLELSSAAALSGLRALVASRVIRPEAAVVLIGTSSGLTELATFSHPISAID